MAKIINNEDPISGLGLKITSKMAENIQYMNVHGNNVTIIKYDLND